MGSFHLTELEEYSGSDVAEPAASLSCRGSLSQLHSPSLPPLDPADSLSRKGSASELRTPLLPRPTSKAPTLPSAEAAAEFRGIRRPLLGLSGTLLSALGLIVLVSAAVLAGDAFLEGEPPLCRKSAALAVALQHGGTNNASLEVLVWSGMARHCMPLSDLHSYDVAGQEWRRLRPRPAPASSDAGLALPRVPPPRWKAGTAQLAAGMLVFGGDAFPPRSKHLYSADLWVLEFHPTMRWRLVPPANGSSGGVPTLVVPSGRRAHSTVAYKDAEGRDRVVVFGGRGHGEELLNDAWEGVVDMRRGPSVAWRQLSPKQPHKEGTPRPRKGHTAVMVAEAPTPQMLVFGGRDDEAYFSDVWLLDLATIEWRLIEPASALAPAGRDHHSAAYVGGKMFIYGGRSGSSYDTSTPQQDLWVLDAATRLWRELPQPGLTPLPRFLNSYTQYTPPGATGPRMLIFGGETLNDCRLNDVWSLNLQTGTWSQLSPPEFCNRKCRKTFVGY